MRKLFIDKYQFDILNLQGMVMQKMSVKKQILRALAFVLILSSIAVMFTGCGENGTAANAYRSIKGADIESQVLASNSNAELSWDLDAKAVVYKSVQNGVCWSDILYDAFLAGSTSANGNSPISITVVDTKTFKYDTITSHSQKGSDLSIVCKKIENGIRVAYFFERYKIAVPIEYTLRDDALNVSIVTSNILEDGTDYKLQSISLAPYLCSVPNDAENGNLLVPTGSGALMSTALKAEGQRNYSTLVYGDDASRRSPSNNTDNEYTRLPVFGAYGNNKGILGVIEEGAGSVQIVAQAGNEKLGYSNVYPVFNVRGTDSFVYYYHGEYQGVKERVNENISRDVMSVTYYPLYDVEANYNGMANKYREHLIKNGLLEKSEVKSSAYGITFWGGTGITESILGIPNKKTVALTTFSQANEILGELNEKVGDLPSVRMLGYGDNGMSAGTVAGGKKYLSAYGSKKDLNALLETTKNTAFFMDSDLVYFNKSGAGFSVSTDTAKTAVMYKAESFPVSPVRIYDKNNPYYAIARAKLVDAANIALNKADKYGNKGISFSTLGTTAFSDYSDDKYISKAEIETDVKSVIDNARSKGYTIAVAGANSYAACAADMLFDISTNNGNYSVFDSEIPFYQLVFHSYKPMYSNAINLEQNSDYATAKAVAYGMGLGYSLISEYIDESDDLDEYKLYGALYDDNADDIYEALVTNEYAKIYSAIADSEIESYVMLDSAVSATTYSNGIVVYVNHTNATAMSPVGELAPYAFLMG